MKNLYKWFMKPLAGLFLFLCVFTSIEVGYVNIFHSDQIGIATNVDKYVEMTGDVIEYLKWWEYVIIGVVSLISTNGCISILKNKWIGIK